MVHFCSIPVRVGDRLHQYYSSGKAPHPSVDQRWWTEQPTLIEADERLPMQAVGRVSFRPDGYVSLDAGHRGGRLETRLVEVKGSWLVVNVDAREGELQVSVAGSDGRKLVGMGASLRITGDHLEAEVVFDRPIASQTDSKFQISIPAEKRQALQLRVPLACGLRP